MHEAITKVIEYGIHNMGLKSIEGFTHIENLPSSKLLEKCNFKKQEEKDSNSNELFVLYKLSTV